MNEATYASGVLARLAEHFHIQTELKGRHFTGKCLRLDAVVTPKDKTQWKNPLVALGIEFKSPQHLVSTHDITGWLKQCIDYSHTEWDGFGYIYIFACPGIVTGRDGLSDFDILRHLAGQLGIGELKENKWSGLNFYLQGHHSIWSEGRGVSCGRHWELKRVFGHQ